MLSSAIAPFAKLGRGIGVRQVRLTCGLILFTYLISHFLNHALGLISPEALEIGVIYHTTFWQYPPIALAFYSAAVVHMSLGIWSLYERREFRWRSIEPLQLALGLCIPVMIISHIIGIRLSQTLYDTEKLYPQVLYVNWVASSGRLWLMLGVLNVAWVHGCIGLYLWLRPRAWFKATKSFWLACAVLLPTLAMLGFYQGGRTVEQQSQSQQWRADNLMPPHADTAPHQEFLDQVVNYFLAGYLGLLGLMIVGRGARLLHERRGGLIALSYDDGRTIRVPKGLTILEASIRHKMPHASVCGGRARCSTCRIRVTSGLDALPPPSKRETFVLDRVGAADDPAVRLACQLRPESDLSFARMFLPHVAAADPRRISPLRTGQERYLVSMFIDMRGSTKLAEKLLPFDTVYIVNQFLNVVSQAVTASGGQPNQFYGDGQLALFGLTTDPQTACRQALRAAARLAANVDDLNQVLVHDGREPIRFGIGIHGGVVIVGDIGNSDHMVFTALGDAVNVAARLQDMTKVVGCETILSEEVHQRAGLPPDALPAQDAVIRGRAGTMRIHAVTKSSVLARLLDNKPASPAPVIGT
ncbi:MAG: adenylate/guanylate cyclase domain-containing protein [Xanthobacteraceae bacterium]